MAGLNENQFLGQDGTSQQKDNMLFPENQEMTSNGLFGQGEFQSDALNLTSLSNQLGDHQLLNRPPIMQMLQFGDVADSVNDSYLGKYESLLQSGGTPIFGNYFEKLGFTQEVEQQSIKPLDQSYLSQRIKDSLNPLSQSVFEKHFLEQQKKQQEAEIQEQKIREQLEKESQMEAAENAKEQETETKIIESCKCSNSKCLKLYCICFSQGILCKDICSCVGCNNTANHEQEIAEARKNTLNRNPHAFTSKVEVISANVKDQIDNQVDALGYKKGCKCKKTNCRKKYCECFNAGVKCTFLCICEDCLNKEDDKFQQPNQVEDQGKISNTKNKKRKHAEQKGDSEEEESESTVSKKSRIRNKTSKKIQKSQKDEKTEEEEEPSLASSVS